MQLSAPDIRIAAVETCDFSMMRAWSTRELLRATHPVDWERYAESPSARCMIATLGVENRYLTQLPGAVPDPDRLNALDLARSAVERLRKRCSIDDLDALIFVSSSNPNPCNSQAALLAGELGISCSCMDMKAGCSGGVLGLFQAALLLRAGCGRVLVVIAENLSQFTPVDDLRMLLTVGDGAACVLLERAAGAGFLSMVHGSATEHARAMRVTPSFPPIREATKYEYEFRNATSVSRAIHAKWRSQFVDALALAGVEQGEISHCLIHQTHRAQVAELIVDTGLDADVVECVVCEHGNMGTPTFAVALAKRYGTMMPGDKYLLQAVGGGMSWCAIVGEHC